MILGLVNKTTNKLVGFTSKYNKNINKNYTVKKFNTILEYIKFKYFK